MEDKDKHYANARKVRVSTLTQQVDPGREYRGKISFDKCNFTYNFKVSGGFEELIETIQRNPDEAINQIDLAVKDSRGRAVYLSGEAKEELLKDVASIAIMIYKDPQMRMISELTSQVQKSGLFEMLGAKLGGVIAAVEREYDRPMTPTLEKFLADYNSRKLCSGPVLYAAAILCEYLMQKRNGADSEIAAKGLEAKVNDETFGENLAGIKYMVTPQNNKVEIKTAENHGPICLAGADLAVIGGSGVEEGVSNMFQGSGLLVARFSESYGKPSKCCGTLPEKNGYSLDIPKDLSVIKDFLTDDQVLESLALREEAEILRAVQKFNKRSKAPPVIITPYFLKALEIEQDKSHTC